MALVASTRKYKRYAAKLKVKLNSGGLSFWAVTSDISKKGLRIRVNQEFPVNKALYLELIMPDGLVSFIKGVVRYVNETPHSEKKFGIGIEIIEDDKTFQEYLKDFEINAVITSKQVAKDAENFSSIKEDVTKNNAYILSPSTNVSPSDFSIKEHMLKANEDFQADITSQESDIIQLPDQIVQSSCEQISRQGQQEELTCCASITNESAMPSESKLDSGRDKKIIFLTISIFLAIGIVASGSFFYRNSKQNLMVQQADNLMCSIQVGAFKMQANAQMLSESYKEKGHDVFVDKSFMKNKGILYKVLIGPFNNKEDTSRLAMDMREKENIDAFVVCR